MNTTYQVCIKRTKSSLKTCVTYSIGIDSVNRVTVPEALNLWISRYGIAHGDTLTISIDKVHPKSGLGG